MGARTVETGSSRRVFLFSALLCNILSDVSVNVNVGHTKRLKNGSNWSLICFEKGNNKWEKNSFHFEFHFANKQTAIFFFWHHERSVIELQRACYLCLRQTCPEVKLVLPPPGRLWVTPAEDCITFSSSLFWVEPWLKERGANKQKKPCRCLRQWDERGSIRLRSAFVRKSNKSRAISSVDPTSGRCVRKGPESRLCRPSADKEPLATSFVSSAGAMTQLEIQKMLEIEDKRLKFLIWLVWLTGRSPTTDTHCLSVLSSRQRWPFLSGSGSWPSSAKRRRSTSGPWWVEWWRSSAEPSSFFFFFF